MLVFNVTFRCKPGMRDEFLRQIKAEGIDGAARAEAGNRAYDFYIPADAATSCSLWKSTPTPTRSPHTSGRRTRRGWSN